MSVPRPVWLTRALPPIGGYIEGPPEDFQVEELPAYPPSGEGEHFFVHVRKRQLTTGQLLDRMARAAGRRPRELGSAGRKDRHAITSQWISMRCEPVDPEDDRIELLEVARHRHKLRMGHLKGNRFTIRLRGLHPEAEARLPALQAAIAEGVPNYFGEQRYGRDGHTLVQAKGLLANPKRRVKDPRFLASAMQSAVFDTWLGARVEAGLLGTALTGEVLKKRETGGLFNCEDASVDGPRVAAGEVDPMGPLPGPKMMPVSDEAAEREAAALEACELDEAALSVLSRFAPGSRRLARVVPGELSLVLEGDTLLASFTLPKGCYATVVLSELCHPEGPLRRRAPTT